MMVGTNFPPPGHDDDPGPIVPSADPIQVLTDSQSLQADCEALATIDPRFAPALGLEDFFPMQARPPGFATLINIILEQQVSVKAAQVMWRRACESLGAPTPETVLAASEETLSECGFSRQKRRYAWSLATAIKEGRFDPDTLTAMEDDAIRSTIIRQPGLGPWSADCYLLFALRRRDILPAGDLALQVAWAHLAKLDDRPSAKELAKALAPFAPRRTAVSYLLWRTYLAWLAPGRRQA